MTALLEVQDLETAYGSSQVLFGVHLAIAQGEAATLLGRNGMGKTTTVRSLLGLTRGDSYLLDDESGELSGPDASTGIPGA